MDAKELLRRYDAGERDFRAIILQHTDLSRVKLDSVNLSGACFYSVNLHAANLKNVNLSSTEWSDCNLLALQFWLCNLKDAIIEHCDLESARFFDCDLRGIRISLSNVSRAAFTRVNFQDAKLGGSGEDPCEFWDVIRPDGVLIPGFTFHIYHSS
ncbi:pentapeptide repeat-containing protein [Laspinema olomoucense]|uniref:Pentapeptide repeat-containing protein n=1 Tax=Laspinema olomoucense D3b TaxID=2953688 RepID=A0ABT2NJK7_9CYAN|nr:MULTISPECIES: pentapeptide repeat-containing protein [unclassified Laspinema]MCT7971793.1 pentapeptide repeat-containing protein [Laspinema sp. D3d]MCT7981515.1 pentapeptide repeat-containing protein [Laspinema sp. D3b]MCT7989128.1 pentapeptide repeat-containing protein [Laspinema sp. D3a]MCT7993397.1 pentapeptide repeat-containing protein [Laspinema sp. D3c]